MNTQLNERIEQVIERQTEAPVELTAQAQQDATRVDDLVDLRVKDTLNQRLICGLYAHIEYLDGQVKKEVAFSRKLFDDLAKARTTAMTASISAVLSAFFALAVLVANVGNLLALLVKA